jgi:hypothetical protein
LKVKLVSYSQPTEEFAQQGVDNAQESCAKVIAKVFPMAKDLVASSQ